MQPLTETPLLSRTVLVNVVLLAVAVALFWYTFANALRDDFTCDALIVERYDLPASVCEGAIGTDGFIGDAAGVVGLDRGDTLVPGLMNVIDGPLQTVRKIGIGLFLVLLALLALGITLLIASLKTVARLVRRDPETWQRLLGATRLYLLVLLGLYGLSALAFAVLV
jgi:hypothetical protein